MKLATVQSDAGLGDQRIPYCGRVQYIHESHCSDSKARAPPDNGSSIENLIACKTTCHAGRSMEACPNGDHPSRDRMKSYSIAFSNRSHRSA